MPRVEAPRSACSSGSTGISSDWVSDTSTPQTATIATAAICRGSQRAPGGAPAVSAGAPATGWVVCDMRTPGRLGADPDSGTGRGESGTNCHELYGRTPQAGRGVTGACAVGHSNHLGRVDVTEPEGLRERKRAH